MASLRVVCDGCAKSLTGVAFAQLVVNLRSQLDKMCRFQGNFKALASLLVRGVRIVSPISDRRITLT